MWFEMIEHFMLRCCWSKIQKLWGFLLQDAGTVFGFSSQKLCCICHFPFHFLKFRSYRHFERGIFAKYKNPTSFIAYLQHAVWRVATVRFCDWNFLRYTKFCFPIYYKLLRSWIRVVYLPVPTGWRVVKISGTVTLGNAIPRSTVVVLFVPLCLHSF